MRGLHKHIVTAFLICLFSLSLQAQEKIDKEIVVVKPYQPTLSDAHKINILPRVSDSINIRPSFEYGIEPKKLDGKFEFMPITPARMVGQPLTKLYKSYLKLGFGNYLAPIAELKINSLRNKSTQWGLDLNHYSINGKLKLANDQKVNPGFFENSGKLYVRKIFSNSYLMASAGGAYDRNDFYGYHPSLDTVLVQDDIKQTFLKADGRIRMGSTRKDSLYTNWESTLDYMLTRDYYENTEHAAILDIRGNRRISTGHAAGLNLAGKYYYTSESIDSGNNTILEFNPWFGKTTNEFRYKLGLNFVFDIHPDRSVFHLYPEALLQINMVEGVLMPYFGFEGHLQPNNFRSLINENPYITPGLRVNNTSHKIRGFVGLKGSFTNRISYDLVGSYSVVDNMPFFYNDTLSPLTNSFIVSYDNYQLIRIHGELNYRQTERLRVLLKLTYDSYQMDNLDHPWHKPNLVITLDEEYSLKNKIILAAGVSYIGKRFAPPTIYDAQNIELKGFVDLNVGLEYRYTKILSGFIRFNNILGTGYEFWNQYPGMGFNVQFGFTYAL